jgi:hypothetical protein
VIGDDLTLQHEVHVPGEQRGRARLLKIDGGLVSELAGEVIKLQADSTVVVTAGGVVFVSWWWPQALSAISILCLYCMSVWAGMLPVILLLSVRNLVHGIIAAPVALMRFADE